MRTYRRAAATLIVLALTTMIATAILASDTNPAERYTVTVVLRSPSGFDFRSVEPIDRLTFDLLSMEEGLSRRLEEHIDQAQLNLADHLGFTGNIHDRNRGRISRANVVEVSVRDSLRNRSVRIYRQPHPI